ncbi:hypothetical protein SH139x_002313 [Planctomycetaceae bacterium SH139]
MSDNPFQPTTGEPSDGIGGTHSASDMKAAYNVVTDTVTGVNVRWSDNKFQAIFIFAAVLLVAAIGAILALLYPRWDLPWYGGALVGSFGGLVIGVLTSGIFLMIYRAARHLMGKHD